MLQTKPGTEYIIIWESDTGNPAWQHLMKCNFKSVELDLGLLKFRRVQFVAAILCSSNPVQNYKQNHTLRALTANNALFWKMNLIWPELTSRSLNETVRVYALAYLRSFPEWSFGHNIHQDEENKFQNEIADEPEHGRNYPPHCHYFILLPQWTEINSYKEHHRIAS